MLNDSFKSRYLPILKVIFLFILLTFVYGFTDTYFAAYKDSNNDMLDILNSSLRSGAKFTFFLFLLLGLFKVFQKKNNN